MHLCKRSGIPVTMQHFLPSTAMMQDGVLCMMYSNIMDNEQHSTNWVERLHHAHKPCFFTIATILSMRAAGVPLRRAFSFKYCTRLCKRMFLIIWDALLFVAGVVP